MAAINSGACPAVVSNGVCATSTSNDGGTTGYYSEFEYNGNRIIVSSGTPDHAAETNANKNPNFRCTFFLLTKSTKQQSFFGNTFALKVNDGSTLVCL